jgi:hypothetical protein
MMGDLGKNGKNKFQIIETLGGLHQTIYTDESVCTMWVHHLDEIIYVTRK